MSTIFNYHDPKSAQDHERHNAIRAAMLAYAEELGIEAVSYMPNAPTTHSILAAMLIDTQLFMLRAVCERERQHMRIDGLRDEPCYPDSPDVCESMDFIGTVGSYDVYQAGETSGSTFIMIRSPEGGDYITTDHPINYVGGFFDRYGR